MEEKDFDLIHKRIDKTKEDLQQLKEQLHELETNLSAMKQRLTDAEDKIHLIPELDKRLSVIEFSLTTINENIRVNVEANKNGFNKLSESIKDLGDKVVALQYKGDIDIASSVKNYRKVTVEKIIGYIIPVVLAAIIALFFK